MCHDSVIRRIAGVLVMLSVALGVWVNPLWFGLTAFIGLNLFQSSITDFCPLERVLGRFSLFGCAPRIR